MNPIKPNNQKMQPAGVKSHPISSSVFITLLQLSKGWSLNRSNPDSCFWYGSLIYSLTGPRYQINTETLKEVQGFTRLLKRRFLRVNGAAREPHSGVGGERTVFQQKKPPEKPGAAVFGSASMTACGSLAPQTKGRGRGKNAVSRQKSLRKNRGSQFSGVLPWRPAAPCHLR